MASRKELWSACLGNLFEHYDAALFGFLSPFLAPLIFPQKEPITALILTYAMIPLGMLVRPFGSLVFGYIGDSYGRRRALFLSLAGMGFVSGLIAMSPTYLQAGILAPLIFCLGRILQNFLASGETIGGAIFLLENTPEKKHDLLSGFYNASTIGGILLASAGVFLLGRYECIDSGWRWLYVFGCLTAFFGSIMRSATVDEARSLERIKFSKALLRFGKVFWIHRKPFFYIAVSSGFSYANYSISLILMNGFIPLVSPLTQSQMMGLNTCLLVFDFCALPLFGWLASKTSREKMMLLSSLSVVLFAIPLCSLLQEATFEKVIGVRLCLVVLGVVFSAPFHAWAQQLVPQAYRYSVISFGYAVGSQLLGGPAAALSLWLFKQTGLISSIAWYWMLLACVSSFVILSRKKSGGFESLIDV